MSFNSNFNGKKILVTGTGRGLGRALTKAIVAAGGEVYALSRQKEHLDTLFRECPGVHPIQVDLTDWAATRREIESLGTIDGLVNNAGISCHWISSLEETKDIIDKTMAVNVMGAINITQIVGRKMVSKGNGGSIVNVSSINGLNPMRESLAYNLSKAALDMMTKQFSMELGPHQIRVNSVNPIAFITDMTRQLDSSESVVGNKLKSHTALGRFAEISEVVGPIMYLLSDCSSMVTGRMHCVEGGLLSNISV